MSRVTDRRTPVTRSVFTGPKSPPLSATSKIGPVSTDRNIASQPQISATTGGDSRTQIYTYIAQPPTPGQGTSILYNGDRMWVRVILTLETAGPVAVGQQSQLLPVLSGKGILLETDTPITITIAKGTRLYVAAQNTSRIKVVVEPLPWLEQITGLLNALPALGQAIASAIKGMM